MKCGFSYSVIIPTYNRSALVKQAIESVLAQTLKPNEIIVVDDGSTDSTYKTLKKYDITYIKTKNRGVSSARNLGIKRANSKWIAFLDSDDLWLKDKMEKQIDFHINNSDCFFSHTLEKWQRDGRFVKYSKRLQKPEGFCFLENISACKIACSSVFLHISLFEDVGYFDEELRVCEDYDLWLRIAYKYKIGLIKEELIIKRAGHKQLSDEIFLIDGYHINSLLNFIDSSYGIEVKKEIKKKCNILIKGSKKYSNMIVFNYFSNLLSELTKRD